MILEHYNLQISNKEQNGTGGICIFIIHIQIYNIRIIAKKTNKSIKR